MRKQLSSGILATLFAGVVGCAGNTPATDVFPGDFASFSGATVEVTVEGGIAALSATHKVEHDSRAFAYVQRHICSGACAAPLDSASGPLSAGATDSLFNIVFEQARLLTKSDYGTTRNAADMMAYTIRISAPGQLRTITADDGTMPVPARRIVDAVRATIAAARQ